MSPSERGSLMASCYLLCPGTMAFPWTLESFSGPPRREASSEVKHKIMGREAIQRHFGFMVQPLWAVAMWSVRGWGGETDSLKPNKEMCPLQGWVKLSQLNRPWLSPPNNHLPCQAWLYMNKTLACPWWPHNLAYWEWCTGGSGDLPRSCIQSTGINCEVRVRFVQ